MCNVSRKNPWLAVWDFSLLNCYGQSETRNACSWKISGTHNRSAWKIRYFNCITFEIVFVKACPPQKDGKKKKKKKIQEKTSRSYSGIKSLSWYRWFAYRECDEIFSMGNHSFERENRNLLCRGTFNSSETLHRHFTCSPAWKFRTVRETWNKVGKRVREAQARRKNFHETWMDSIGTICFTW